MERIIPPIRPQDQGPSVANLQQALLFIVEKRQLTPSNLTLAQWQQALQPERMAQSFGQVTRRLFVALLNDLNLPNTDFVNETTAERLNQILEALGAFLPTPPPPSDGFPLVLGARGAAVAELQTTLREVGYSISPRESTASVFGDTTHRAVGTFQQSRGLESTGIVDQSLVAQIKTAASVTRNAPWVVLGVVRRSDATAVQGAVVRAFDADFRGEELLGENVTDNEGRYSIAFSPAQASRVEKDTADLFVRVFDATGERTEAVSPITFQAARLTVIDVILEDGRRRSEYERHMALLERLAPSVSPADYTREDLIFLIGETGIGARVLAFLCVAHKHARATGVQAPAFYGQFRQNAPTNLTAFLLRPLPVQRAALERSIKDFIIPAELATNIDEILTQLQRARGNHVLTDSPDATSPLGGLLISSGVSSSSQEKFLNLYLEHTGRIEDFWKSLEGTEEIPRSDVEPLRFALQLALLTRNNLPLVKLLTGESRSLRDLVQLDVNDWIARIRTAHAGGIPLPPDLPGENDESKISAYAADTLEVLQDALPMDYLRKDIEQDVSLPPQQRTDLITFLNRAPQFDLLDMSVSQFLSANQPLLEGIPDPQAFTTELKRMQRVFRLTQRYGASKALVSKGWDSALLIAETPFTTFLEAVGPDLGGVDNATKYYKKAKQTAALSANIYGSIYQYYHDVSPAAVGGGQKPKTFDGVANWQELFGSVDYCECKHCRSVYGPAAYFVDLLQFLRRDGAPFTALMKRRPDLEHLKLTCENTNTHLPYVDIANEIMEFFVVNVPFEDMLPAEKLAKAKALAKDTGAATAEELSVNPQFVDDDAYTQLLNSVFSFRLPFNRSIETARVYLEHLGSSLHEVMSVFQNATDPNQKNPDDLSVAREYLKITSEEFVILTGQSTAIPRAFFGYPDENILHKNEDDTTVTELWRANLARVPEFLRRTGVSFNDVVDLLKTRFINPVQQPEFPGETVVLFSPEAVCDLNQTWIQRLDSNHENLGETGLSDTAWIRIHRFLRLWNKLGWSQQELDRAIIALGGGDITVPLIEDLARLAWLRSELNRPIVQLLSFWSPIDTFGDDSLYLKLFQNKAITNPEDTAFALNDDGTELADTNGLIAEHTATLQAGLRINADELTLLCEATGLASENETLNLSNISSLYRHALLAKSLKLKIRDFLVLKVLTGTDPFANPDATRAFVERARRVKASQFKITELNYLFRHISEPGKGVAPAEDATIILLQSLQKGLLKIVLVTEPVVEPTSEMLRSKLALVLSSSNVDIAMSLVDGTSDLTTAEQEQFIDNQLSVFIDPVEAKAALLPPPSPDDEDAKQARRTFLLGPLLIHLRDVLSRSVVKQTLTDALSVEAKLVQFLVEELLTARSNPNERAIVDFVSLGQGVDPVDRLPDFIRVHKIALLLDTFDATPEEISYIATHSADFGDFNLNSMPLDRTDATAVDNNAVLLFAQWEHLRNYFELREKLPQADMTLLNVVAAPSASDARSGLAKLTGWDAADIDFLSSDAGLGVPDADFRNAIGPQRFFSAFSLSRKTGISVKQLGQWAREPITATIAQDIINAVKAKYDDEQWLTTAKSLNDELREKRKLALIAFLLADKEMVDEGITNSNELYEYFLIDVNMDPCMMTSRIKQAISSVQLFVQRSLLNLEKQSKLSPQSARRWLSMKSERLWGANRKVFLYPENWLDWRDDKSPLFKELENQLLQNDLTPENVEQAFMTYLEKLDDIGRLEACGMYREKNASDGVDRVHIFARTFNTPYRYFYRSYDALRNRWSPWVKAPDIEGDHLIPVVWNRRLHLFWPIFVEKPEKYESSLLPEGSNPLTFWEIKIAWSEYRQNRWTAKQISSESILSLFVRNYLAEFTGKALYDTYYLPKESEHYFHASVSGDDLKISCFRRFDALPDVAVVQTTATSAKVYYPDFRSHFDQYGDSPDYHTFGHEFVGSFVFTGCRGRAEIAEPDPLWNGTFDSIREPEDTFNVDMAFLSTTEATELRLQDSKNTKVLQHVETPFNFLPSQELSDLGKTFYPFVFQDAKRSYLAMPTYDDPRLARQVFRNPFIGINVPVEDAIVSKIPLPDNGDSGSVIIQKSFSPFATFSPVDENFPETRFLKGAGTALLVEDQRTSSGALTVRELRKPSPSVMKKGSNVGGETTISEQVQTTVLTKIAAQVLYLKFHIFFHPHVCEFIKTLNHLGVPGLMTLATQQLNNDPVNDTVFDNVYDPAPIVHDDYPKENVDFRPEGAYSLYNWELFFHAPLLIADSMANSQRFEDALKWLQYIFDPTNGSSTEAPAKYWRFLPFHENDETGRIEELLETLNHGTASEKKKLIQIVEDWRDNPFNPHLIARSRMIAYQKNTVMKCIEILIRHGDQLNALDTMESINEATQLYVLAYHLLGRRPERIPPRLKPEDRTYEQLKPVLDSFSNAMIELENAFPFTTIEEVSSGGEDTGAESLGTSSAFYFCIPPNDKLLSYWDTVEDRLFKIRHCMNIQGVVRQLPLFDPPIDPALLVKAAAAGIDLSSVLNETQAPLTPYRAQALIREAAGLCAEVKSLGQQLLATMEKIDGEALSALRARHETIILEAAREAREHHISEARNQLEGLRNSRKVTEERQHYYEQRLAQQLNREEQAQLDKLYIAHAKQSEASQYEIAAQAASLGPSIMASALGYSSGSASWFGGSNIAAAASAFARALADEAADATYEATANAIRAGHARRSEDWTLQLKLATKELAQIDKQIVAAEIRLAIAEKDLQTHDKQIENASLIEEFLRTKGTNDDLYRWILSHLSAVCFQSFKLAYDMAKRAERACNFELVTKTNFIQFGYWDSFTKGQLAAETLLADLNRLQTHYLEHNGQEYEITKHVSLLQDPLKLIQLKEEGWCEFELTEALLDADIQGLYCRRIKSVGLTIPCIVGPYTSINCKLTLLSNKIRATNTPAIPYNEQEEGETRFISNFAATTATVMNHAINDTGTFELNFHGDRYLPFEGAGVISRWRLELIRDKELRQFDYDTITDVGLHIRYFARDGGAALKAAATEALKELIAQSETAPLRRFFSARHEFPSPWHRFLKPQESEPNHVLTLDLVRERFPFMMRARQLTLQKFELFLKFKSDVLHENGELLRVFVRSPGTDLEVPTASLPGGMFTSLSNQWNGLPHIAEVAFDEDVFGRWRFEVQKTDVPALLSNLRRILSDSNEAEEPLAQFADAVEDLYVVCHFAAAELVE